METAERGMHRGVDDDVEVLETDPTGRYVRYKEILGRGSFKTVYRAFDEVDGREVAWNQVKIDDVLRSPEDLERLYSEVHLLKSLQHENIVQYLNSWVDGHKRTINLITELFTSGSLRQYRKKYPNVDMKAVKSWARQILHGLHYLHTHNPPILHRDLKCDNILVNGNKGEVKIGDLGLAIIMQRPSARSVIGTPEFMAPELYEEEYNQLVDVYSFGMCLLEMITLEYPYSECKNAAQIYKKVIQGVKPLALVKVVDPQMKELIERCLLPASERCSVKELLQDPFFQSDIHPSTQDPNRSSERIEYEPMNMNNVNSAADFDDPLVLSMEFQKTKDGNQFLLRGDKIDYNTISFTLRIINGMGDARNIHFTFYLDSDSATAVAREMVENLSLYNCDDAFIARFIDFSVSKLIPGWSPPTDRSSNGTATTRSKGQVNDAVQNFEEHRCSRPESTAGTDIDADIHLVFSNLSITDSSKEDLGRNAALYRTTDSFDTITSESRDAANESSFASSEDSGRGIDLKLELETLDVQYQQKIRELNVLRERALDDAKRRYLKKKVVHELA